MKHELQKVSKIVHEIVNFYLLNSSTKTDITVENKEDRSVIIAKSDDVKCTQEQIEEIRNLLKTNRQREVEGHYWQLAGEDELNKEFNLVGLMTDESSVEFENGSLTIKLTRYKES